MKVSVSTNYFYPMKPKLFLSTPAQKSVWLHKTNKQEKQQLSEVLISIVSSPQSPSRHQQILAVFVCDARHR